MAIFLPLLFQYRQKACKLRQLITQEKENSNRIQAIIDTSLDGLVQINAQGQIIGWNKQAEYIFGWTNKEASGKLIFDLIVPLRYREAALQGIKLFVTTDYNPKYNKVFEIEALHKKGHEFPIELATAPIIVKGSYEFSGVIRDITERKASEQKQLETTQQLREKATQLLFQQNALDEHSIVSIADVTGNIVYANERFLQISKFTLDELIGKNHRLLKSDFHPDSFFKELWTTISSGKPWHGEIKNTAKDGSTYWVDATIVPFLDKQGKPLRYIALRTDITDLKAMEASQYKINELLLSEKALTEQETRRLDTIIDIAMDAAVQVDDKGIIIGWNAQAEKIFGWQKKQAVGQPLHTLILPERHQIQHIAQIEACLQTGDSTLFNLPLEITAINQSGAEFPIEIAVSVVKLNGRHEFSAFMRDLTKQKKYELSILKAKESADKANKSKSEFLSSMSHELRTPLNGILGFAQLLEMDPLSEDQQESLGFILSSGKHLLSLINDVLELSAIEAGKVTLSIEPLQLIDVINESLSLLKPLASKANLTIDILSDLDFTVNADYTKLKQVIINLVTNAIKYNRKNGSITLEWKSTDEATLHISIKDTGIGISAENQHKVFGAFNRLGQENSTIEGTGIGLVVTKNLVELMGGNIGFESVENEGSTFWFELPIISAKKEKNEPITEKKEATFTEAEVIEKNILYVEDNPANRRFMASLLKKHPHLILHMAETGELGWDAAIDNDFDLILMDINLPGMDGKELTQKLRETTAYESKPIIAVSAAAMSHDLESAEGLFDAYITKPIQIPEILAILKKHLN